MTRAASPAASEAAFQAQVVRMARDLGWGIPEAAWRRQQEEAEHYSRLSGDASILDESARMSGWSYHTRYSLGSDSGMVDLFMARLRDRRVLLAELKSEKGRLSPRQAAVIELLRACGLDVRVWRPSDMAEIERTLR